MFFLLNLMVWGQKSSGAAPFGKALYRILLVSNPAYLTPFSRSFTPCSYRSVALQVEFEGQTLKPVFHLIGFRLWV
jgi:hypothetical protein